MRKNRLKGIIALGIMIFSLILMYVYLTFGQEAFSTKSVLVTTCDIEQGTIISNEHITEKRIRNEDIITGSLETLQLSEIIGLASTHFIPGNSQILNRYFAKPGVVVTGEKFVYKIPNNWIYAVPSSIRRNDEVLIYEVDAKIDQGVELSINVEVPEKLNKNSIENTVDETLGDTIENNDLSTYKDSSVTQTIIGDKKPILQATVIYVKDSANREVVDVDGGKRLDASSQVSSIEIVCTEDDIVKIEKKVAEGKKLILVYR